MEEAKKIVQTAALNEGTSLELSSLDLDTFPCEILSKTFQYVTILNLDYNDLKFLPKEISYLSSLKVLSATGNQLQELPDTMKELENLESLHLNENCLHELPVFLSKLQHLKILDAIGNGIESWKEGFGECLLELRLDENNLRNLPHSFSCMKNLKVLELGDNNLTSLPDDTGALSKLEIFNLSHNELSDLPESLGNLPCLKTFDLSGNSIENLPEKFQSAEVIESLFVDKNYLKILPSWFGNLLSIENLGIADNELLGSPLPDSFGTVSGKSLKTLDLSANNISNLPETMGELKKLEKLQLGSTICELERRAFQNGNRLFTLPSSFGWMVNLQKLHLDENQLVELPENFGSLINLEWVDFGQNRLQSLPPSFCLLTKLWYLQLSQNYLQTLPENFGNLTSLIELRLNNNYLKELPSSFANLINLQTLDLFHNELTKIPKELLNLKKLLRLDLDKNKFKLRAEKVPKLTKQVKYPEKDLNLKDNWRGKLREDYIEPDKVTTIEILNEVDDGASEDETDTGEDGEETNFSEAALEYAMKRSLSIWKSHKGPDEREAKVKEQAMREFIPNSSSVSQPQEGDILLEHSKNLYSNIFEDADAFPDNESHIEILNELKDQADAIRNMANEIPSNSVDSEGPQSKGLKMESSLSDDPPSNNMDTTEDWDKEIQDSLAYNLVLETFKERSYNKVYFQNQLQNLLYCYPPASQAFTKTANYESAIYSSSLPPPCKVQPPSPADTGQFDDADEDGAMES
ncbi:leucine-rich repeat-containing protein 1-like [Orbicella faveolata]|uniref:leucine-rich repeat-containing protein 1-like n=1 Tax=Orbicella faveolata TaxID=48498 RepID=UPI0009E37EAB|nr:leucine-rich repeat-containing protein 1-like [Orbicella faveolata]